MKFLSIIETETERLSNLINDILTLSSIENDEIFSQKENVDLMKVANNALILLFINLIDNAVKYNRQAGTVDIYTVTIDGIVEIHVKDSGIGIDETHIPRLFERFYRVDKGRSRNLGGTGLGLSIVKHIALLYNGGVSVNSTVGEGSDFCVSIPLAET